MASNTLPDSGCRNELAQLAISSYLDGEADPTERAMAEWHLAECRACNQLLAGWSADSGRLRHAAQPPQVELITRAIADQTRYWLSQELLPTAGRPVQRRPGSLFGALGAALVMLLVIVGVALTTTFPTADTGFARPISPVEVPATVAMSSPATVKRVQSPPVTPLINRTNLTLPYNSPAQLDSYRELRATPLLNQVAPLTYITPAIARSPEASGRD